MVSFTERVRRQVATAMKESGVSRNALADQTGIPRPTLNRSLDGHRPLNTDEIEAIAKALDVPLGVTVGQAAA